MSNTQQLYNQYVEQLQKIADLKYALAVLQWDQETYMPRAGANARARQVATLSEMAHKAFTSEHLSSLLKELISRNDLTEVQQKNVALSWQDFEKQMKYSSAFVRKMSEITSQSFNAWIDARAQKDFSVFSKPLEQLVALKREEAEILGYENHAYNALLNEYEKGCTVFFLDKIFDDISEPLAQLLQQVQQESSADESFLQQHFSKEKQWEWGMYLIEQLGFDLTAGRQDLSEHPFTINFSAKDVRITTRVDEQDFANMTWSCIHEVGHALYEQGLPDEQYGLPCGEYTSLSIHESQSRLWENNVGRGLHFWKYYYPKLQEYFGVQLKDVSVSSFYKAINKVQPSFIRTEADELTYHLHVKIRYNIEKDLIAGTCNVKDVPSIWNEQYQKYLGVCVKDDVKGCLQDVHWSHGSFGYFPTYSLGSFYAAQFYEYAKKDIIGLENEIAAGNTNKLLTWLRQNIHQYGRFYTSDEICKRIGNESLNTQYFIQYLTNKLNSLNSI